MRLNFGEWTLDEERRQLLRGGVQSRLSPKAFELLRLLAVSQGRACSKAELHEHLWPGTFVTDGNLALLIAEIRRVLQDDAQRPRYVRTVQRFGYAFAAEVSKGPAGVPAESGGDQGWVIWGGRSIQLAEGATILGRAVDAGIRFDFPGVSRQHARITVTNGKAMLEDLESRNGTSVRGRKIVTAVPLADGDEIHLGPVAIVFRLVSPDSSTLPM